VNRRILTLVVAVALMLAGSQIAGCRRLRAATTPSGQSGNVVVTVVVKAATPGLETEFKSGDLVRIKASGSTIGSITSITTTPTLDTVGTSDGRLVAAEVPNQEDILLKIAGTAVQGDDAFRFSGERVWVNQDINFISPFVSFTGTVLEIKPAGK
jgi:hypothetical protein